MIEMSGTATVDTWPIYLIPFNLEGLMDELEEEINNLTAKPTAHNWQQNGF